MLNVDSDDELEFAYGVAKDKINQCIKILEVWFSIFAIIQKTN